MIIQTLGSGNFYYFTKTDFFVKSPGTVLSSQNSDQASSENGCTEVRKGGF
jgi:hypothetical protein